MLLHSGQALSAASLSDAGNDDAVSAFAAVLFAGMLSSGRLDWRVLPITPLTATAAVKFACVPNWQHPLTLLSRRWHPSSAL